MWRCGNYFASRSYDLLTHSLTRHSDSQIIWRILRFHLNVCQIVCVNAREIPRRNMKSGWKRNIISSACFVKECWARLSHKNTVGGNCCMSKSIFWKYFSFWCKHCSAGSRTQDLTQTLFDSEKNMTRLFDFTRQSSDCVWYPKTQSSRQFFNSFPNIFFSFFLPNQIGNKLISIGWFGKNTSLEVAWFGTGWGIIPDIFPTEFGMVQFWGWIRSPRQS